MCELIQGCGKLCLFILGYLLLCRFDPGPQPHVLSFSPGAYKPLNAAKECKPIPTTYWKETCFPDSHPCQRVTVQIPDPTIHPVQTPSFFERFMFWKLEEEPEIPDSYRKKSCLNYHEDGCCGITVDEPIPDPYESGYPKMIWCYDQSLESCSGRTIMGSKHVAYVKRDCVECPSMYGVHNEI